LRIATMQLACAVFAVALSIAVSVWAGVGLLCLSLLAPQMLLAGMAQRKRDRVDALLPNWLVALANGLRSTPAIAEALSSSARLIPEPLREELDLCLKEVRLGTSVENALENMRDRLSTSTSATAIAALLVARRTGGDLPMVLEETASSLREMERLEGVLRTRTAEGKGQAWLMGAMPFGLAFLLHTIDDGWLDQLTGTGVGQVVLVISIVLWLGAIVTARRVLAVEF